MITWTFSFLFRVNPWMVKRLDFFLSSSSFSSSVVLLFRCLNVCLLVEIEKAFKQSSKPASGEFPYVYNTRELMHYAMSIIYACGYVDNIQTAKIHTGKNEVSIPPQL